jgi:putative ABC transport system permease protein
MFRNYFTTAIRNLFRNKVYSFINISGLSLGLASAMLIILYVKDETSYDRFHANVKNIYRITVKSLNPDGSANVGGNTGYLQGPRFTANVPGIRSFVRIQSNYMDMKNGDDVKSEKIFDVDSNFFSMFSFPLISGNPKTALLQPNSMVISEEVAKQRFGTTQALNKTIMVKDNDNFVPYTVTAVAKNSPQNSSIKFKMLTAIKVSKEDATDNNNWFYIFLNTFVVLDANANIRSVEAQMQKYFESDARETIKIMAKNDFKSKQIFLLQPFTEMHLSTELGASNGLVDGSNPVYSYILTGIAVFILLIACINFINLTIARSLKRAKEIGIRKVVGGERKQLIIQFLGESFTLCFIAFVFAILIVQLVLPVFNQLSNKALALSYLFDIKLVAGYVLLFLITGLLAGFYPALVLSKYNPVQTLYSRFQLTGKNYLQKSLVVLQFALASFLIIATFTVFSQFRYLTTEKLGYDDSNLLMVENRMKPEKFAVLKNELLKSPSIINAAPKNGGFRGTIAKVNNDSTIQFAYETVDETYIPLLKIPVVLGRNFSAAYPSDSSQSVLVNEAFVKNAGWENPIGQEVNFWYQNNKKYKVIGVVKNYHYETLGKTIDPQLFTMKPNGFGVVYIKIKPNSEARSLQQVQKVFKNLFPHSPYTYKFKDQENLKNYEAERKWKQIMLYSAILTIFISCIGLFGLSVLSAEKRTKEIGIRKVLGASVSSVATILSKDFLKLVLISLFISIPLAWIAGNKWLENYPYRITLHWAMFLIAALLVILVAIATVSFQAIKAAVANPVKSLRTE